MKFYENKREAKGAAFDPSHSASSSCREAQAEGGARYTAEKINHESTKSGKHEKGKKREESL